MAAEKRGNIKYEFLDNINRLLKKLTFNDKS